MGILILAIFGHCIGYVLGLVHNNTIKKIDGKQETDKYMKKTYGEYWYIK